MTTLATNKPRAYEGAEQIEQSGAGVIAADTVYEGAAVGIVDATGYAQPLAATLNRFGGFCVAKAVNETGAAGDVNVDVITRGRVQLTVSGVLITDRGQPVYATDDDTFQMSPVGGIYIGRVHRWVSSGVAIVAFDVDAVDPWQAWTSRLTVSADLTLDATHTGKLLWVDTDAKTITLPAVATGLDGVRDRQRRRLRRRPGDDLAGRGRLDLWAGHHRCRRQGSPQHQGDRAARRFRGHRRQRRRRLRGADAPRHVGAAGLVDRA
jgi:hypothetical protein